MKLNLGSGTEKVKGFINVDLGLWEGVDIVHNLENTPYLWEDHSVSEIRCWSTLEHIHNLDGFMKECYRILKKDGLLDIKVPYFHCGSAVRPDHVRFFNYKWYKKFITLCDKGSIQNIISPKFVLVDKEVTYSRLGKIVCFLFGERLTYLLSLMLGEIIQNIRVKLVPFNSNM